MSTNTQCNVTYQRKQLLDAVTTLCKMAYQRCCAHDTSTARKLLAAAKAYCNRAGGGVSHESVWLTCAMQAVCQEEGKFKAATRHAMRARKLALECYGSNDPNYGVITGNCGEALINERRFAAAEKCLRTSIAVLQPIAAAGGDKADWATGGIEDAKENLRRALRGLGRGKEADALV